MCNSVAIDPQPSIPASQPPDPPSDTPPPPLATLETSPQNILINLTEELKQIITQTVHPGRRVRIVVEVGWPGEGSPEAGSDVLSQPAAINPQPSIPASQPRLDGSLALPSVLAQPESPKKEVAESFSRPCRTRPDRAATASPQDQGHAATSKEDSTLADPPSTSNLSGNLPRKAAAESVARHHP